jgi:hypothetical protein
MCCGVRRSVLPEMQRLACAAESAGPALRGDFGASGCVLSESVSAGSVWLADGEHWSAQG